MTKDRYNSFLDSLPPSFLNSSRSIIQVIARKAEHEKYGGYWTRKFEEMTGFEGDRTGYDCGMKMERLTK